MDTTKKVKFKIATQSKYNSLKAANSLNDNWLYFIKDKGVLYKGSKLYTDKLADVKYVSNPETNLITVTLTMLSGEKFSFQTVSAANLEAVQNVLQANLEKHAGQTGTGAVKGHVLLHDAPDGSKDQSQGYAATPAALFNVIKSSKNYTDGEIKAALESLGSLMRLKGTIGTSATDTYENIPTEYEKGDAYFINVPPVNSDFAVEKGDFIVAMDNTGHPVDWKILQANLVNAILANESLSEGNLVVAANSNIVKTLPGGNYGQVLSIDANGKLYWKSIEDKDTKYTFASGDGAFTVDDGTDKTTVSIGKPATAGTADKVKGILTLVTPGGGVTFDGSSDKTLSLDLSSVGAAPAIHGHVLTDDNITGVLPLTKGGIGIASVPNGKVLVGYDAVKLATKDIDKSVTENSLNLIESGAVYAAMQSVLEEATPVWGELE